MKKNPHAVSLGKKGGAASVKARRDRAGGLSGWGRKAVRNRWGLTLKELARECGQDPAKFRSGLKEFIREFVHHKSRSLIAAEPPRCALPEHDAYLAAMAEGLAMMNGWPPPRWVYGSSRVCARPYFAGAPEGMKPYLLQNSPGCFRRRNIFVYEGSLADAVRKVELENGAAA